MNDSDTDAATSKRWLASHAVRYLLLDARARTDFERATVFECCETFEEAQLAAPDYGADVVIWDTVEGREVKS